MSRKSKIWKRDSRIMYFNLNKKLKKCKNNYKANLERFKPYQHN